MLRELGRERGRNREGDERKQEQRREIEREESEEMSFVDVLRRRRKKNRPTLNAAVCLSQRSISFLLPLLLLLLPFPLHLNYKMMSKTMMTRMPCAVVAPRVSVSCKKVMDRDSVRSVSRAPALCFFCVDVFSLSLSISVECPPFSGLFPRAFAFSGCALNELQVIMRL